ncbi:MAG: ATP-binding cassette domain-containing protein [Treponema sp.]|nr:ATP-binding cassette domain-containing protein [Treponema sp.]
MPLLEFSNVKYRYPQSSALALNGISFSIQAGEYVAVLGLNGSGKSTAARLMAGFIEPDSGSVKLAPNTLPGIVFQQPKEQIIAGVVERDTAFGPQNLLQSKSEIELRAIECLSVVGLIDKAFSRTFELSLGQLQRLAFSGTLALFPDLLILDEVTSMLDPQNRETVLQFIDEWHRKGHTVVHITHDESEALRAQRVLVLEHGELVFDGTPLALSTSAKGRQVLFIKNEDGASKKTNAKSPFALVAQQLSFFYADRQPVFSGLSFALRQGTVTALTGPSGIGKTTLLECLSGLLKASAGTVLASQRPLLALQESEAALFEPFAADDVAFGPRNQGKWGAALVQSVKNAMNIAGIPYDEFGERKTFEMSGGEKRKLAIAGIIAMDGDVLLFDEPTAALDAVSRETILRSFRVLARNGKTILFTTHRMEEAETADMHMQWDLLQRGAYAPPPDDPPSPENLVEQKAFANSGMLAALKKAEASCTAPPHIPDSPIQRLPPLFKYLAFLALFSLTLCFRTTALCLGMVGLAMLYSVLARYPLRRAAKTVLTLLPWLLMFAFFQLVFFPAKPDESVYLQWHFLLVTPSKLRMLACSLLRLISTILAIGVFVFTTNEREILDGLSQLLFPLSILKIPVRYAVLVVGIIFRFIPLLLEEAANIIKTQMVRGTFGTARGLQKIRALVPLFVPLILQTLRKAQAFADALTARYFS